MNKCSQSELEKEVEDVKLLQESLSYQEDDPSQQQQALRALGEILCQNSEFLAFIQTNVRLILSAFEE